VIGWALFSDVSFECVSILHSSLISLADRIDVLIRDGRAIKKGGLDVENDLIHLKEGTYRGLLDELTKLLATCYIHKMRHYHC